MASSTAERMLALFEGFDLAHGTHGEPHQEGEGLKWAIKKTAKTVEGPASAALWVDHIKGKRPLGVAPTMRDNTCVWGSIDIDDYEVNAIELVKRVESMKLPLVPCWSKSGGVHLFLFVKERVPAIDVQRFLMDIRARLGYASAEVFPKQAEVKADRGDKPNWMVMPYFGGDYDGRLHWQVGIKAGGGDQTITEFLDYAEGMRQARDALRTRPAQRASGGVQKSATPGSAVATGTGSAFADGPPCLQHLAANGVQAGHQNNTLVAMGIYYKKAQPGEWEQALERANHDFLDPPGSSDGLSTVIRSLRNKDYRYGCKNEPLKSFCNSAVCRARRFGVGDGESLPVISGVAKLDTEPPVWFVSVDDKRLEVSTDVLQQYARFHVVCMEQLNVCYMACKQSDWLVVLAEAMRDVNLIDAPAEVGRSGVFFEVLEEFLTNRKRGNVKEDILNGRPWEDEDAAKHYFRMRDLDAFVKREGDKFTTRGQMATYIRNLGGDGGFLNIKGRGVNVFWVPSHIFREPLRLDPPEVKGVPV